MCVDDANVLKQEWFSIFKQPLASAFVKGNLASADDLNINLWLDIVSPLLKKIHGTHFVDPVLDAVAAADPAAIFASEPMLRLGSPVIVLAFSFVGLVGNAEGSVASVLATLKKHAIAVERFPPRFSESQSACSTLLMRAGSRAIIDFSAAWRLMLATTNLEQARRPPFVPDTGGMKSHLSELEDMLEPIRHDIRITELGGSSRVAPAVPLSPVGSLASVAASSCSSVGPSASQIGAPPSAVSRPPQSAISFSPTPPPPSSHSSAAAAAGGVGSLVHTLARQDNGVWYELNGRRSWCTGKGPDFDIGRVCLGALCPEPSLSHLYCSRAGSQCSHKLGARHSLVVSPTVVLPDANKRPRAEGVSRGASRGCGGSRGGERARGRGRQGN